MLVMVMLVMVEEIPHKRIVYINGSVYATHIYSLNGHLKSVYATYIYSLNGHLTRKSVYAESPLFPFLNDKVDVISSGCNS